ncbi:MAG: HlyD family efflux transporter periplasmic adaptor subunit [Pirellulaceae bacterium]|nr:HlyD family efflux transporter periplasmic adaptor subunit [Pirellulaceae bacterium]
MNFSTQPSSSAIPPVTGSPMHVSLVGSSGDAVTAAPKSDGSLTLNQDELSRMLRLIESVARTTDRTGAVETIVKQIAISFPNDKIRCGIGNKKLRRLYDGKLGWLGCESTMFDEADQRWQDVQAAGSNSVTSGPQLSLAIPEIDGAGRCVVWVDSEHDDNGVPAWLLASLTTLRIVLWDRPAKSWLRLPENLSGAAPVWLACGMLLLILAALWPIRYRVACTATVEPLQQRFVAMPFEATLLETKVRPGDSVQAGELLALLDGRPLRLELEQIEAEIQQVAKEENVARATGRIADAQQSSLKVRQLTRRKELVSDRLERLEVVSPIDGVIVSGDLRKHIGAPLEIGQTIAEVAPLNRVAIEIEIPEYEIGYVKPDADTRVRLSSVGGESIRTTIEHVYPAAEIRDDRSVFVARIEVDNQDGKLRPGMRGDATTYGPLRPTSWSWIRGICERVLWWVGY